LHKMLSRHSRTSSSLVPPPPMALFIFLAVFVVHVLLRVYTNLLPVMRVSPFLLSKPYYLVCVCCYCFCNVLDLPIMCCSYKLAFRRSRLLWKMMNKKFLGCVLKDLSFIAREPPKIRVKVCSCDLPHSST
jgi:hypothetical protein